VGQCCFAHCGFDDKKRGPRDPRQLAALQLRAARREGAEKRDGVGNALLYDSITNLTIDHYGHPYISSSSFLLSFQCFGEAALGEPLFFFPSSSSSFLLFFLVDFLFFLGGEGDRSPGLSLVLEAEKNNSARRV